MNEKFLCDVLYIAILVGGFSLLLCIGEGIFTLLYRVSPQFRRWWDNYCEGLPDWDDDKEVSE